MCPTPAWLPRRHVWTRNRPSSFLPLRRLQVPWGRLALLERSAKWALAPLHVADASWANFQTVSSVFKLFAFLVFPFLIRSKMLFFALKRSEQASRCNLSWRWIRTGGWRWIRCFLHHRRRGCGFLPHFIETFFPRNGILARLIGK